jgi:NADPH:quinone reductase-like Zn-dependent oxidoreductase
MLILDELIGEGVVDQAVDYTKGKKSVIETIGKQSVDFFYDPVGQALPFVSLMKPKDSLILSISTLPSGKQMKVAAPNMKWYLAYILNLADWFLRTYITTWWGVGYAWFDLVPNGKDLKILAGMVDRGELRPVVGEVVKLSDLEGVRRVCGMVLDGKGGVGKFVVEVD